VQHPEPQATVTLDRTVLDSINLGQTTLADAIAARDVAVDGDQARVMEFVGLLDSFDFWFNIVTP
jgi:alkyl sulfatase BDS1-like metallo-beta-lactamase superfamily hydrolase